MPTTRILTLIGGGAAIIALTTRVTAQSAGATDAAVSRGRVMGIYDDRTGSPIDGAEVRDLVSGTSALTTATGTVSLFFIDPAGALVRIRKVGYSSITVYVESAAGSPPMTVTLQPIAQYLPAVVTRDTGSRWTSPSLRGFEERRKSGLGYFIPDSALRRLEHRSLGNVIRAYVPSVNVYEGRAQEVTVTSRREPGCPVDVYIDGLLVSSTMGKSALGATRRVKVGDNNIGQYQVSDIAAVEFHNVADAPAEYSRVGAGCGVLLIWTR